MTFKVTLLHLFRVDVEEKSIENLHETPTFIHSFVIEFAKRNINTIPAMAILTWSQRLGQVLPTNLLGAQHGHNEVCAARTKSASKSGLEGCAAEKVSKMRNDQLLVTCVGRKMSYWYPNFWWSRYPTSPESTIKNLHGAKKKKPNTIKIGTGLNL